MALNSNSVSVLYSPGNWDPRNSLFKLFSEKEKSLEGTILLSQ